MLAKLYHRRQGSVRAFQYTKDLSPLELIWYYSNLRYDGIDLYLTANYIDELVNIGDWLMVEKGRAMQVLSDDEFYEYYKPN